MFIKGIIISALNMLSFPLMSCILLESKPDLSDNTKAVFDELLKRKVNEKYKIIWIVEGKKKNYPKYNNVKYIRNNVIITFYKVFSKALVCSNYGLVSRSKGQFSIYLSHGLPIKSVRSYYTMPEGINYMVSPSETVNEIMSREFNVPMEKIVSLGYPRNDVLTTSPIDIKRLFAKRFNKVIVWYPTFRQTNNGQHYGGNALPIIHDANKAMLVNETAKRLNTLIVLKPHFAQNISYIKDLQLSNIMIISDSFFSEHQISSYEFLAGCDALITDYSSVYYDFTLCDKPIAVIWEDIEEYKKSPGFAVDLDEYLKGAVKLYTDDDFCEFIKSVSNGEDLLKFERNEVKQKVTFTDGKSASRVVDFIMEQLN